MMTENISSPQVIGPFSEYLGANECSILIDLVKSVRPRVMIEFGCNLGITAKRVLENVPTLEKYIGVDVPAGHLTTLVCQLGEVPQSAGCYADDARFHLLSSPTQELEAGDLEPCDAVFIDGDHSFPAVTHESLIARDLVRPGGIIVWHDFQNPSVEVTETLVSLCEQGWPIVGVRNSWLAFMRRPRDAYQAT
jgi:predicted O-methyltransferase YrrM